MAEVIKLSNTAIDFKVKNLADRIDRHSSPMLVYGVPRGGIPIAYLLKAHGFEVTDLPSQADIIVDDLIDSGDTQKHYVGLYGKPFYALLDKQTEAIYKDKWIVFPWEASEEKSAEDIPIRLLQYIGEDITRGGLKETPKRFLKAWKDWTKGYFQKPEDVLKVFEDGAENYDEMIVVSDIPVYSHCEHHLAPFFGTAQVAYIPDKKIVGLSKIVRLVEMFAKRLQVQERLTSQIADALQNSLKPQGVGVLIKCRHLCMESRGIECMGACTTTSALRGVFMDKTEVRNEFLRLVK